MVMYVSERHALLQKILGVIQKEKERKGEKPERDRETERERDREREREKETEGDREREGLRILEVHHGCWPFILWVGRHILHADSVQPQYTPQLC